MEEQTVAEPAVVLRYYRDWGKHLVAEIPIWPADPAKARIFDYPAFYGAMGFEDASCQLELVD